MHMLCHQLRNMVAIVIWTSNQMIIIKVCRCSKIFATRAIHVLTITLGAPLCDDQSTKNISLRFSKNSMLAFYLQSS